MVSLLTIDGAQRKIAENIRQCRLQTGLTQAGLAKRSGVSLSTLRKFEQKGVISLESLLMLLMVLGKLEDVVDAIKPTQLGFSSIDEVLKVDAKKKPKNGWHE